MTLQETLQEAFKHYEDLYRLTLDGEIEIYFREITKKEFNLLSSSAPDGFELEDLIFKLCVIWPTGYDVNLIPCGIPAVTALNILRASGIGNDEETEKLLADAKATLNNFETQMDVVILTAFQQYRQEDLDKLSRRKAFELFAKAEWSLNLRGLQLSMQKDSEEKQANTQAVPNAPTPEQLKRGRRR